MGGHCPILCYCDMAVSITREKPATPIDAYNEIVSIMAITPFGADRRMFACAQAVFAGLTSESAARVLPWFESIQHYCRNPKDYADLSKQAQIYKEAIRIRTADAEIETLANLALKSKAMQRHLEDTSRGIHPRSFVIDEEVWQNCHCPAIAGKIGFIWDVYCFDSRSGKWDINAVERYIAVIERAWGLCHPNVAKVVGTDTCACDDAGNTSFGRDGGNLRLLAHLPGGFKSLDKIGFASAESRQTKLAILRGIAAGAAYLINADVSFAALLPEIVFVGDNCEVRIMVHGMAIMSSAEFDANVRSIVSRDQPELVELASADAPDAFHVFTFGALMRKVLGDDSFLEADRLICLCQDTPWRSRPPMCEVYSRLRALARAPATEGGLRARSCAREGEAT